jgi:hypothetical protein
LPPSVRSNTKYECEGCGAIADLSSADNLVGNIRACDVCGSRRWKQLRITRVCDFCGTGQNLSLEFPCEPFTVAFIPGGTQTFDSDWCACEVCAKFIEANDREGLIARGMLMNPSHRYPARLALTRMIHNGFFDHRAGDPVPIEED